MALRGISSLACASALALALAALAPASRAETDASKSIQGSVVDESGKPLAGVMITATDGEAEKAITVVTQPDGTFQLKGLRPVSHELRARVIGRLDEYIDLPASLQVDGGIKFVLKPAEGEDLELQRRGVDLIGLMSWPNEDDAQNFRMMCTYCHQVGTIGWRTPEEPVDWEVMVTRMDGFGGLYDHTKKVLVDKLVTTYTGDAMSKWPKFVPPPAPEGKVLSATVTEWWMGKEDDAMIHDLELDNQGGVWIVDMVNDAVILVDTKTNERKVFSVPGGKNFESTDIPRKGPHSIELGPDGKMWMTLALSGEMASLDPKTGEWVVVKGNENDRRGFYPHTLRVGNDGIVWYTDAALNSVFKLDPKNGNAVKRYKLPTPEGGGPRANVRGEGGAIVPYGIDIAPDGKIWYSKLNGQRLGVIDPATDEIKEWKPPINGPRRFMVAPDGIVWVPGFASGDFASFDPKTEQWKVHKLPYDGLVLPYALHVSPKDGSVWVCGTGSDSMFRFDPKTEELLEYRMPTRVTYTREVEFDNDGNIWVCNSNYPARHIENHRGSVIKLVP